MKCALSSLFSGPEIFRDSVFLGSNTFDLLWFSGRAALVVTYQSGRGKMQLARGLAGTEHTLLISL